MGGGQQVTSYIFTGHLQLGGRLLPSLQQQAVAWNFAQSIKAGLVATIPSHSCTCLSPSLKPRHTWLSSSALWAPCAFPQIKMSPNLVFKLLSSNRKRLCIFVFVKHPSVQLLSPDSSHCSISTDFWDPLHINGELINQTRSDTSSVLLLRSTPW